MAEWVGCAAWLLEPWHAHLLERIEASSKLYAHEKTAPWSPLGAAARRLGSSPALGLYARRPDMVRIGADGAAHV